MSCSDCMHTGENQYMEEKFSSFVGGLFLTRRDISNFEFCELLNNFQDEYNVNIADDDLLVEIELTNNAMFLIDDYDDVIVYNNKKMSVKEYLYTITSLNVRNFFGLNYNLKQDIKNLKRKLIK